MLVLLHVLRRRFVGERIGYVDLHGRHPGDVENDLDLSRSSVLGNPGHCW